jgi:hypothetical protein
MHSSRSSYTRETREGLPLVTVKTETNGDLWSTNERARRAGTSDFYPAWAALIRLVQNIFFLTARFFTLYVPFALQPGHAGVPGRLSLNMCL